MLNLRKVEIHGFKSFPDKTEIVFDTNMTGIVGPNGCGKSNVVEAVRWVLGEQKTTVLRFKKNVDLIFSGTKTGRKSQSYCEVSIFLNNSEHLYPIEFEDLVVTRKLDRSGESSSYINGQKCNLKDVVNLFRDTGVGKEGYSIIGQGRIDNIVSYKPEARREIFEEAAGISKHKDRKNISENKLARTRDNMLRINDIMQELEANLGPLKDEAEQAREAKLVKEDLKKEEIKLFLYQSENSEIIKNQTEASLRDINEQLLSAEEELNKLEQKYNTALKESWELDTLAKDLNAKILDLTLSAQKTLGTKEKLSLDLQYKTKDFEDKNTLAKTNVGKLETYTEELSKQRILLKEYIDKLSVLEETKQKLEEVYVDFKTSLDKQETDIENRKQLLMDGFSKKAEIDKNRATYELELKMLSKNVIDYNEDIAEKKAILKGIDTQLADVNEIIIGWEEEKLRKVEEISLSEENLFKINEELKEADGTKNGLSIRIANLEFKRSRILEEIENYTSYDSTVQNLMEYVKKDEKLSLNVCGTVAEILNVSKEYIVAIEAALGGAIQNIITPTAEAATLLIDILKANSFGRATFLPVETVKPNYLPREFESCLSETGVIGVASDIVKYDRRYANIVSSLLGRTVLVEDKKLATEIARKYKYSFKIITLQGEVFSPSGAISGGSIKSKRGGILNQEEELLDSEKKLTLAKKEMEMVAELVSDLISEKNDCSIALGVMKARRDALDKELIDLTAKRQSFEDKRSIFSQELEKLINLLKEEDSRIVVLTELLKVVSKSKESADSERISIDDYIEEAREKLISTKRQVENAHSELVESQMQINSLNSLVKETEKAIASYEYEYRVLHESQVALSSEISQLSEEITIIQHNFDTTKFSEEDKNKLNEAKVVLSGIDNSKEEANKKILELDEARKQQNQARNLINEKKIKEESTLEKINFEIGNMAQKMEENYSLDFVAAKSYWGGEGFEKIAEIDVQKSLNKIFKLRKKIERIGPINELAEEKYAQESVRYEEMHSQYDDLEKAEADLVKLIMELTTEMEEKFVESFKQINVNFQETFKELFIGGSGQLTLEKGVNPLVAGINIDAQPPGKDLKSIELLSGGEKTLTAIAILFAINKLTPMPFSILDEIDASLDEANARRFAQYLSRFSKNTQFIVVTHRKPTMTLCDVLYGVTMQEKGVSKIVKAELKEAVESLECKEE